MLWYVTGCQVCPRWQWRDMWLALRSVQGGNGVICDWLCCDMWYHPVCIQGDNYLCWDVIGYQACPNKHTQWHCGDMIGWQVCPSTDKVTMLRFDWLTVLSQYRQGDNVEIWLADRSVPVQTRWQCWDVIGWQVCPSTDKVTMLRYDWLTGLSQYRQGDNVEMWLADRSVLPCIYIVRLLCQIKGNVVKRGCLLLDDLDMALIWREKWSWFVDVEVVRWTLVAAIRCQWLPYYVALHLTAPRPKPLVSMTPLKSTSTQTYWCRVRKTIFNQDFCLFNCALDIISYFHRLSILFIRPFWYYQLWCCDIDILDDKGGIILVLWHW